MKNKTKKWKVGDLLSYCGRFAKVTQVENDKIVEIELSSITRNGLLISSMNLFKKRIIQFDVLGSHTLSIIAYDFDTYCFPITHEVIKNNESFAYIKGQIFGYPFYKSAQKLVQTDNIKHALTEYWRELCLIGDNKELYDEKMQEITEWMQEILEEFIGITNYLNHLGLKEIKDKQFFGVM